MIKGVGMDLVELERIRELLSDRFIERILSEKEMKEYQNLAHEQVKLEFIGGRFAAKEAISKALGTGIGNGVSFQDIEIFNNSKGAPEVKLTGGAAEVLQSLGAKQVLLSLSDEKEYAIAYAVLV